jgi:hypothetical protein
MLSSQHHALLLPLASQAWHRVMRGTAGGGGGSGGGGGDGAFEHPWWAVTLVWQSDMFEYGPVPFVTAMHFQGEPGGLTHVNVCEEGGAAAGAWWL